MTSVLSDPECPEGPYNYLYLKGKIATGLNPIEIVCLEQFRRARPGREDNCVPSNSFVEVRQNERL